MDPYACSATYELCILVQRTQSCSLSFLIFKMDKQCLPHRTVEILWGEMHKTFYTVADMQELFNIQY